MEKLDKQLFTYLRDKAWNTARIASNIITMFESMGFMLNDSKTESPLDTNICHLYAVIDINIDVLAKLYEIDEQNLDALTEAVSESIDQFFDSETLPDELDTRIREINVCNKPA